MLLLVLYIEYGSQYHETLVYNCVDCLTKNPSDQLGVKDIPVIKFIAIIFTSHECIKLQCGVTETMFVDL